ncbi:MAG: hypothetical protein IPO22_24435 [Anaerolineales bacterium]|nr:hypothetical protein [Anaerolineales bacterium]
MNSIKEEPAKERPVDRYVYSDFILFSVVHDNPPLLCINLKRETTCGKLLRHFHQGMGRRSGDLLHLCGDFLRRAGTSSTDALLSALMLAMFSMDLVNSDEFADIASVAAVFSSITADTESTDITNSAAAALTFAAALPASSACL